MSRTALAALALLVVACGGTTGPALPEGYAESIAAWQVERAERLQAEGGWLSLAGLHWLEPGANPVGSAADATVRLEADGIPPRIGTLHLDAATLEARFEPAAGPAGETVTFEDGEPLGARVVQDDSAEATDVLRAGRLTFYLIRRGDRVGVRVKDPEHPNRLEFAGLEFFPLDPALRVEGRWVAHAEPETLAVPSVIGQITEQPSHGRIEFELGGERHVLRPMTDGPDDAEPFVVFKDATAGRETYGAGRFLYAERDGDRVVLDFNRAYNPPCAYTPYATCPLPPPGNTLAVRVEAGEKTYAGPH